MPKASHQDIREIEKLHDQWMLLRAQLRICRGLPSMNGALDAMLQRALRESDEPTRTVGVLLKELGRL